LSSEGPAWLQLSAGARARGPWLAGPSPEVDHIDDALCQGWSVLVRGPAHRVAHPAELRRLQEDAVVWPGQAARARSTCGSSPARSPAAASSCGRLP